MDAKTYDNREVRKVAIASFIGTSIEWYDFFLYMFAAATFVKLFFPGEKNGIYLFLGTYAIGFVARPLGGIVFGHLGDRIGRKSMLIWTLLVIGLSTFLIGFLPPHSQIGFWAPILLVILRFVQGFGIGGEWGGAVLMAFEYSSKKDRGFFGSFPQIGVPVGLFFAAIVFYIISSFGEEFKEKWGWRIGFWLSFILVLVGVYIRKKIAESPLFVEILKSKKRSSIPLLEVLREGKLQIFLAAGIKVVENCTFYTYTALLIALNANAKIPIKYDPQTINLTIAFASFLGFITIPLFGWLSDLNGRRKIYLFGVIFTALFSIPAFWLIGLGNPQWLVPAVAIAFSIGYAAMYGPQASLFSEMFETKVRYSGISLGYQFASIVGGVLPFFVVGWVETAHSTWPVFMTIIALSVISTACLFLTVKLPEIGDPYAPIKTTLNG